MAVLLLVLASCAVMGSADGVETMGVAVGAHVAQLGHLLDSAETVVLVGVHVLVFGLLIIKSLAMAAVSYLIWAAIAVSLASLLLLALRMLAMASLLVMDALAIFGNVGL
jgi:hypothetical protein